MDCLIKAVFPPIRSCNWISALAHIGAWVVRTETSRPVTVAICLPRVEFAGLLVASGACLQAAQSPLPNDWHQRLGDLAGRRIAYSLRGKNPHVYWEGILCKPEQNELNKVRIQGTSDGNLDHWPLADLFSIQLDPEKDGQSLEPRLQSKKGFRDERSSRLRALLPENAVGRLCSWWHQLSLVGIRNRIHEELGEYLPCRPEMLTKPTFADLLRPDEQVADSAIVRLLSAKDLNAESARGIIVIEGSRRLSEHLNSTRPHSRVVLLARNEPHYSDCAEIVTSHFQQRCTDAALPDFEYPEHIKLKIFYH